MLKQRKKCHKHSVTSRGNSRTKQFLSVTFKVGVMGFVGPFFYLVVDTGFPVMPQGQSLNSCTPHHRCRQFLYRSTDPQPRRREFWHGQFGRGWHEEILRFAQVQLLVPQARFGEARKRQGWIVESRKEFGREITNPQEFASLGF